jgi:hypothetical protein
MVDPIYIVTGLQRTGTSMMMACAVAGGLTPAHNRAHTAKLQAESRSGGYVGNTEYYELAACPACKPHDVLGRTSGKCGAMSCSHNFIAHAEQYEGLVVKDLLSGVGRFRLPPYGGGYRVVMMTRPFAEAAESYERHFGTPMLSTCMADQYGDPLPMSRAEFDFTVLSATNGFPYPLVRVAMADLVADPVQQLRRIGWPIDVEAAARVPTPAKVRVHAA